MSLRALFKPALCVLLGTCMASHELPLYYLYLLIILACAFVRTLV